MAQRPKNDALERKLQPIYDALDARNWKAGLKLADAALKKFKNNQLIRSLKSFALAKLNKQAEALQICADLVKEGPEDELVLNTLTYTYKTSGRLEDITTAYLAATERNPSNTELLTGLFAAYVREFNFVKQQQTATRLIKAAGGSSAAAKQQLQGQEAGSARYTWWAVCSLGLQARAALLGVASTLPADKLLQLAETMAMRHVASIGGVPATYEELLLLLDIMHGQGKHAQALQVLNNVPKGSAALPLEADRLHLQAAALARSGDKSSAAEVYKALVMTNPDDWASWALYLDCMLPASTAGGDDVNNTACSAAGAARFPVGVVGGVAELWDRRHPWRLQGTEDARDAGAQESAWQAVQSTLTELQQAVQSNSTWRDQAERGILRGPTLAPLEVALRRLRLARRGRGQQEADTAERAVAEEVLQVYRSTAGNSSCTADLRAGLAAIATPTLREWLAGEIHAASAVASGCLASTESRESVVTEAVCTETLSSSAAAAVNGSEETSPAQQQVPKKEEANEKQEGNAGRAAAAELRRFQSKVNAYQVEFELGLPCLESTSEVVAHAAAVLAFYQDNLHLSASLDEKDRGYGEELVCIAAAALLRASQLESTQQQASKRILQAVLVVEAAQVRRRVSAPLRLAAAALYSLAGAPTVAASSLSALDIKFILHDTLTGHWLLPALLGGGAEPGELKKWLFGISNLHEEHCREAGETLMLAHYSGTYSKIVEFVDFKERLALSHTRAIGRAEEAALKLRSATAAAACGGDGAVVTSVLLAALEGVGSLQDLPDPSKSLLGSSIGGEGSEESHHSVLRFNEDLSTRPAWLQPHEGPCRLAVAEWWDAWRRGGCNGGYAQCWWSEAGAANASTVAPAAAWRRRQLAALTQRWLLPGLLSAALSSRPTDTELAVLRLRLRQLAAAQGVLEAVPADSSTWEAEMSAHLVQQAERDLRQVSGSAGSLVGDVSLAMFFAAHGMHATVLADPAVAAQAAATVSMRMGIVQRLLTMLCQHIASSLGAPGMLGALPAGGSFCLASALLLEEGVWLAACLQAWSKLLRLAGGKKQPTAEEGAKCCLAQLRAAIQGVTDALRKGVAEVQSAVDAQLAPTQQQQVRDVAAELDLFGAGAKAGRADVAASELPMLWGFEPAFKPLEVLQRLVGDQREVLGRLKRGAKALLSMLAGVHA